MRTLAALLWLSMLLLGGCSSESDAPEQEETSEAASAAAETGDGEATDAGDDGSPFGAVAPEERTKLEVALTAAGVPIAADGYPTGPQTPEGAACDLTRAFINNHVELFRAVTAGVLGEGKSAECARNFMDIAETDVNLRFIDRIIEVYEAEEPSEPSAIEQAAAYGFADIKHVAVVFRRTNGLENIQQTMVLLTPEGEWKVMPAWKCYPELAAGLAELPTGKNPEEDQDKLIEPVELPEHAGAETGAQ